MKKIVPALIALIGIGILSSSCAMMEFASRSDGKIKQIKIGVTIYQMEDPFISTIPDYIGNIAKTKELTENMKITVNVMDAKGNQNLQNDQVDKFLAQNYDVLCVNMVDRTAASVIIDRAKAANVPIVFFNREPVEEDMQRWDKLYYVCSLASESANLEGGIVVKTYEADPKKWDKNGDEILQYVILEGEQGHQDSLIRTEMTIKTITEAGIKLEKLSNKTADWQRTQAGVIMSQWLEEFGDQIEMIISNNDNMALGAIDTYQEAQITNVPLIVGIDAIQPALEAIKNGMLVGTVLNDAKGQGEAIFELAYALAMDEDPVENPQDISQRYIWIPHSAVTIDNVDEVVQTMGY